MVRKRNHEMSLCEISDMIIFALPTAQSRFLSLTIVFNKLFVFSLFILEVSEEYKASSQIQPEFLINDVLKCE